MPYIKQEDRPKFDALVAQFAAEHEEAPAVGEMNYLVTSLVHVWLEKKGVSYTNLNAMIGMLDCAKMELYRQLAAPYEDQKKRENGNVSILDEEPHEPTG